MLSFIRLPCGPLPCGLRRRWTRRCRNIIKPSFYSRLIDLSQFFARHALVYQYWDEWGLLIDLGIKIALSVDETENASAPITAPFINTSYNSFLSRYRQRPGLLLTCELYGTAGLSQPYSDCVLYQPLRLG
jgi:hypothetical protein